MNIEKLKLFQKLYDFTLWLMPHTEKFPKIQRFALATDINKSALGLLTDTVDLYYSTNRVVIIRKMNNNLDKLRIMIRLSSDFKYISVRQYEYASEKLVEIGKILGGFNKRAQNK